MEEGAPHNIMEDEGAGYLISVSDMMSGLLFIFIITLVVFILIYQNVVTDLTNSSDIRAEMLKDMEEQLKPRGIHVKIDEKNGVLRLTENAIKFESGKSRLRDSQQENLLNIQSVLAEILPCYAANPPADSDLNLNCQENMKGKLESVFIEGHTDNVPLSADLRRRENIIDNWDLSVKRAIYTYREIIPGNTLLQGMINTKGQPIFSVGGYGETRPLEAHEHLVFENCPDDRRIDLRFIMTPPAQDNEIVTKVSETVNVKL